MKRKDERDTMFARMNYKKGSKGYIDYYSRNPGKKESDDELRDRPGLYSPDTPYFDQYLSQAADANFDLISDIRHLAEGKPSENKTDIDSKEISEVLKKLTVHYGALDAGIAVLSEDLFYSHRGRLEESYGDKIEPYPGNALVFTIEMDEDVINTAPMTDAVVETSAAYVKGGIIGLQIAYFIRGLGYNARCHMDGNYLIMLSRAAVVAGLGEIGRNGLLVSRKKGCFCRIGAVTTDIPLVADPINKFGLEDFCRICRQCIRTCPGKTVPDSDNPEDWYVEQEKCYGVWRNLGTDCGICISACPVGQEIGADEISRMNEGQMRTFMEKYRKENGTRKRNVGYFRKNEQY